MGSKSWIWAALLTGSLATVMMPSQAFAQSDEDRAAAQALFNEAQEAKKDGDLDTACSKFEKSQQLDPAVGTQLNLADCFQQAGKTASAWVNYIEVAESSTAGERRSAFARKRADKLQPMLTKLVIKVDAPVDGMTIQRGDKDVPKATWGTAVPVDPGQYEVTVSAPGKLPWSRKVEVEGEGEQVELRVPLLEDAPVEDTPDDKPKGGDKPAEDGSSQMIAGGVVMGLGIVGVAVGAGLAATAHGKYDESLDNCDPNDASQCNQAGVDLREEAQSLQLGYMVSFGVGGAALIAGIVVMATAPSSPDGEKDAMSLEIDPMFGPEGGLLRLRGRF